MMNENPILKVAEIEISYHPAVKASERLKVTSSFDAEQVFRNIWDLSLDLRESFYALYLDRGNKVLGYILVSLGGISGTVVDPKCIFQTALKANACSVILAHNHPSGNPVPSEADIELTKKLVKGGKIIDITVLDHLIIMPEGYYSMADEGLI